MSGSAHKAQMRTAVLSPGWGEEHPLPARPSFGRAPRLPLPRVLPSLLHLACPRPPPRPPRVCWELYLDTESFILMLLLGAQLSKDEK